MDRQSSPGADGAAQAGFWNHPLWILLLLALMAWQGWMTLGLFGPDDPWNRLTDDQPVVSGCHPLHLYFGSLGAQSLCERGTLCCYVPDFQAGFPKTPVFDSGSRPAELFLSLSGGAYDAAAYKVGLAICCCLAPLLLALAARGLGLARAPSCLASALGLLIWWGGPCRDALEAGDLDFLLAALAGVAQVGLLVRFHRQPDVWGWFGLLLTGWLGWFTQPFLFLLMFPLLLVYYVSVGVKHPLRWHLALLGSLAGALGGNSFWLPDWVMSWWIRRPVQLAGDTLLHRTFHTFWSATLWGDPADRWLTVVLLGLGMIGVVLLNQGNQRPAARLTGLGAAGFLLLAMLGIAWNPLGRLGTSQLLVPALWFALLPAVHGLVQACRAASHITGNSWRGAALVAGLLLALGFVGRQPLSSLLARCQTTAPLDIGLGPDRTALVETLKEHTTEGARILWEDRPSRHEAPRWTALLPRLTERSYLGGIDPEGWIEHSFPRLVEQTLAGRPISAWSDADLEAFCRRYDVGWAVCWSPASVARFRAWKEVREQIPVNDEGPGFLFVLQPRSFVLKGQAQVLCVNRQRIALANVVPEDGKVVLSQHYQSGMQATPGRVLVERDPDPFDPIPFIRLRMPGPVARITLTYEVP